MGKYLDDAGLAELSSKIKQWGAKKAISGSGAPSLQTVGEIGQIYVDTTNKVAYICNSTTGGAYVWQKLWSSVDTTSWNGIRDAVRMGYGEALFPVGTEFTVTKSTGNIVMRVVDHDNAMLEHSGEHSMLLCMKYAYGTGSAVQQIEFDTQEAMYYCETALSAGTYNFTAIAYGAWVAGTYQFTLTQIVPAGGQLCINGYQNTALTSLKVVSYASQTSKTAIEQANISVGSDGTSLGTWGTTTMNHPHRISYGSNNYKQSGIRQFINQNTSGWTPQTKFDRPPSWLNSSDDILKGFTYGMDSEFLNVVADTTYPYRTNSVYEYGDTINTVYELTDKFFLLSRPEVFGTYDSVALKDGIQGEWYQGKTASELTTYDAFGVERYQWLRSPYTSHAHNAGIVYHGAWIYLNAINAYGVFVACQIS